MARPSLCGSFGHPRHCGRHHVDPYEFIAALPVPEHRRGVQGGGGQGWVDVILVKRHADGEGKAGIIALGHGPGQGGMRPGGAIGASAGAVLEIHQGKAVQLPLAILVERDGLEAAICLHQRRIRDKKPKVDGLHLGLGAAKPGIGVRAGKRLAADFCGKGNGHCDIGQSGAGDMGNKRGKGRKGKTGHEDVLWQCGARATGRHRVGSGFQR